MPSYIGPMRSHPIDAEDAAARTNIRRITAPSCSPPRHDEQRATRRLDAGAPPREPSVLGLDFGHGVCGWAPAGQPRLRRRARALIGGANPILRTWTGSPFSGVSIVRMSTAEPRHPDRRACG